MDYYTHFTKEITLFQDDADTKHRTKYVLETIDKLFIDRILHEEDDAKFVDVWPIEKV